MPNIERLERRGFGDDRLSERLEQMERRMEELQRRLLGPNGENGDQHNNGDQHSSDEAEHAKAN